MSETKLYCHDPRHDVPCPLPCLACMEECDGPVTHEPPTNPRAGECEFEQRQPHEWYCTVHKVTKVAGVTEPVTCDWSGSPDPADPDNYWIDDDTGERVSAATGERTNPRAQTATPLELDFHIAAIANARSEHGEVVQLTDAADGTTLAEFQSDKLDLVCSIISRYNQHTKLVAALRELLSAGIEHLEDSNCKAAKRFYVALNDSRQALANEPEGE